MAARDQTGLLTMQSAANRSPQPNSRNREFHLVRIVVSSRHFGGQGFRRAQRFARACGGTAMEMRMFGRTEMQLSVLGFGCGAVGGLMVRGDPLDRAATSRA